MRDVRKRATVNERGVVFQCLYKVWLHRVFQQNGHSTVGFNIATEHRGSITTISHNHVAQTVLQILKVLRKTKDRHNFRCHSDVKTTLTREAVCDPTEVHVDLTQGPVVHVQNATPCDTTDVDLKHVAPVNMVIHHRSQQVVG